MWLYVPSHSRRSSCILFEFSSSDGFGGKGPLGNTSKLGNTLGRTASRIVASPMRRFVKPGSRRTSMARWSAGRRTSASTSRTRCPCCASMTATLIDVVDFPSFGPGLEKSSVWMGSSSVLMNMRFIRRVRYASAVGSRGSSATNNGRSPPSSPTSESGEILRSRGITPSTGMLKSISTSALVRTVRSRYSRKKAAPIPRMSPRIAPSNQLVWPGGATGTAALAESTTRTYVEAAATVSSA